MAGHVKVAIVSITNSEWSSGTSRVRTIFPINNGKMSRTEGHNDMSSNVLLQLLLNHMSQSDSVSDSS